MSVTSTLRLFIFLPLLIGLGNKNKLQLSDEYSSKTFTIENGLPNNFIQNINQDQTGFLWIATWDGLSRYDGYEFKNYYHKPDDTTSFPFFIIDKMLVDYLNNLWILCQQRTVVKYNRAKDRFDSFYPILKDSLINDFTLGIENDILFISFNYLYQFRIGDNHLSKYKFKGENSNDEFRINFEPQIILDNKGGIWVFGWVNTSYRIFKCQLVSDSIIQMHEIKSLSFKQFNLELHNNLNVFQIYVSGSEKTWLFSKYGLYSFNPVTEQFVENTAPISPEEFTGKPYFVWTSESTGINIIDTKNKNTFSIKSDSGKYIETAFIDRSNTIWSGDISESRQNIGMTRHLKTRGYFKNYLTKKGRTDKTSMVSSILKDKNGLIWVGIKNSNNLLRFNRDNAIERIKFASNPMGESHPYIHSMVQDSSGIWMGCSDNLLVYYDFKSKHFTSRYFTKKDLHIDLGNMNIHNILKDQDNIIINCTKGIFKYNTQSHKLTKLYAHPDYLPCLSMVKNGSDGYWLGMNSNTVYKLNRNLNEKTSFKFGKGTNNTEHVCLGNNNDIWVAFMGGGIGHLSIDSEKTEILTTADGLGSNTCYSLLMDKNGNLWISTISGISRYNTKTKTFRNFTKDDGLKIVEFESDSYFSASDGEMFFGGVGGFVSFYPDSIGDMEKSTLTAPLVITDFKISGTIRIFQKAVYESDTLTLKQGDNNFQLTFACLDFQNANKIKYRYRLIGESNKWMETDYFHRNLNFRNIIPGDYKLEIEATDLNGNWASAKSLVILIPSFYYETLWFKLTIIVVIVTIILAFVFMYIHQIELKAKQKQDKLKLESLGSQMNPHFIFNSLNSINYFISKNDKLSANHYIADFSRLIRSILSNMSSDYVPFCKELESIHDYLELEHLRFSDKFNYTLNAEAIENPTEIYIAPGMVQPFIENAIWHGVRSLEDRIGLIRIEFSQTQSGSISCSIEDDGIGRKLSELNKNSMSNKKSYGINITKDRMKIINQLRQTNYQITIEDLYPNQIETGTKVSIDLPEKII